MLQRSSLGGAGSHNTQQCALRARAGGELEGEILWRGDMEVGHVFGVFLVFWFGIK